MSNKDYRCFTNSILISNAYFGIKDLIKKEKQKKGILLTDYLYEHVVEMCDKIYLIKEGSTHLINYIGEIESLGYAKILPANNWKVWSSCYKIVSLRSNFP